MEMAGEEIQMQTFKFQSLERPDWMIKAGLDKGTFHDRHDLGVVLPYGTEIYFRLKTPASSVGVQLRLLNDDGKTEKQSEVKTEWRSLFATVASVPFVDTLYTEKAGELIEIEVTFVGDVTRLSKYYSGTQGEAFFTSWNATGAAFALLCTKYAQILVPVKDKVFLSSLGGLQKLSDYYDQLFEYFNYLTGLSFDTTVPTDRNIPNRYFMKADKSGGGAAYYGGGWTAEVGGSVAGFWLDVEATNWGCLHEVSHGYQGFFFSDEVIQMGEIWNNVLSQLYQDKWLGTDVYSKGWLYTSGEERFYADARKVFDLGMSSAGPAGHFVLFFYMLIIWKTGEKGLAEFYQRYRRIINVSTVDAVNYPAMDMLSSVSIDVGNADVSGFMEYVKVKLTRRQIIENSYSGATPVCPLYVPLAPSDPEAFRKMVGVRSFLHLVSTAQLAVTGLKGGVIFKFKSDVYNQVVGKSLVLKSGSGKSRVISVRGQNNLVADLPVGIYSLQLPSARVGGFEADRFYVVVRQGISEFDCVYIDKRASVFADQAIYLGGLSGDFGTIRVNISQGALVFDVASENPHEYFKEELYAKVTIKNSEGRLVFEREILGKTTLFHLELSISPGFTIEVIHVEPDRLRVSNVVSGSPVIDETNKVNILTVTELGLVNQELGTDAGENLKAAMERAAEVYERLPHLVLHDDFPMKGDFVRAINLFAEPERSELFSRYKKIEFSTPGTNGNAGGNVVWYLKGFDDGLIGLVSFKLSENLVELKIFPVMPHSYFAFPYVAVVLKSSNGEIRYLRELRGDALAEEESVVLSFTTGDTVSVMHKEPSRNYLEDEDGFRYATGLVQHATYSALRRLELSSYWSTTLDNPGSESPSKECKVDG